MLKIALGSDHRGFLHKQFLYAQKEIAGQEIEWTDCGAYSDERSDYPEFAGKVARLVHSKAVDAGILFCGSGIGMAITANRLPGIYAGVVWNAAIARSAKEDDHVNILVIPTDYCTPEEALSYVIEWITASPKEGRYVQRLNMIDDQLR